jgi:dTDP-4-amino-4,6-dideoxygalactose transaminase
MNELNAIALYDQLTQEFSFLDKRKSLSKLYSEGLNSLIESDTFRSIEKDQLKENFHGFYILLKDHETRNLLKEYLVKNGIESMFHYIPLHNSTKGITFGEKQLPVTDLISETILRLPLHAALENSEVNWVIEKIKAYFND